MSIVVNDNFEVDAPKASDPRFGPWPSVADAEAAIKLTNRFIGLPVGILNNGKTEQYHFESSTANGGLVKIAASGQGPGTQYTDAMAVAAVGAAELQIITNNSLRVRSVILTRPVTISNVIKHLNTDYLLYQVNYHNGTRWIAGASRLTPADARADMDTLDFTALPLPELLIQLVPFVAQDPAVAIVDLLRD